MAGLEFSQVIAAVIIATLLAIIYSLRILVLLERRMARIDSHIESLVKKVLKEELVIERKEATTLKALSGKKSGKKKKKK